MCSVRLQSVAQVVWGAHLLLFLYSEGGIFPPGLLSPPVRQWMSLTLSSQTLLTPPPERSSAPASSCGFSFLGTHLFCPPLQDLTCTARSVDGGRSSLPWADSASFPGPQLL